MQAAGCHLLLLCAPAEADATLCATCVDVLHHDGVTTDHLNNLANKGVTQLGLASVLQATWQSTQDTACQHAACSWTAQPKPYPSRISRLSLEPIDSEPKHQQFVQVHDALAAQAGMFVASTLHPLLLSSRTCGT